MRFMVVLLKVIGKRSRELPVRKRPVLAADVVEHVVQAEPCDGGEAAHELVTEAGENSRREGGEVVLGPDPLVLELAAEKHRGQAASQKGDQISMKQAPL